MCASSTSPYLFQFLNKMHYPYLMSMLSSNVHCANPPDSTHAFVVQTLLIWQEVMIYKSLSTKCKVLNFESPKPDRKYTNTMKTCRQKFLFPLVFDV